MAATEQEVMRLIAEAVDHASPTFRKLQKTVHEFGKSSGDAHKTAAKEAREHAKRLTELHERLAKVKDFTADAVIPTFAALGISFISIGDSLGDFTERLRKAGESWKVFNDIAKRGGVSPGFVSAMGVAFQKLGIAPERANEAIAKFGAHMDKIAHRNPDELNALTRTFGNMGESLAEAMNGAHGRAEEFERLMTFMSKHNFPIYQKRRWLEFMGLPPDLATRDLKDVEEAIKGGLDFEKTHPTNMKVLHELDDAFTRIDLSLQGLTTDLTNAFGAPAAKMINNVADAVERFDKALRTYHTPDKGPFREHSFFGWLLEHMTGIKGYGKTPQGRINQDFDTLKEGPEGLKDRLKDSFKDYQKSGAIVPLYQNTSFVSGGNRNAFYQVMEHSVRDGVIDAFRELMGIKIGGSSVQNASYTTEDGLGLSHLRSGSVPKSTQGVIGRMTGGSRGDRNNNPGNLKFGALARSFGATHADAGGYAVFPDYESGAAAQAALVNSSAYSGLTLEQFWQKYDGDGNRSWMDTVGKALGIGPNDIVNNHDPRLLGAIRKAEGTHDQRGRPFYMHGVGTMEGFGKFHWGSGGAGRGSIPYGDYPITPGTIGPWGTAHGALGINGNRIFDPKLGSWRAGIELHASSSQDLDRLYTEGCFAIAPSEWPAFKRSLLAEIEKHGPMYLHVGRNGQASITHMRTSGNIMKDAQKSGVMGGHSGKSGHIGHATLTVDFNNMPHGTRTALRANGLFKEARLNRGRAMPMASQDA